VKTALFDYELAPERIAQRPLERRDAARLLVLHPHGTEDRMIVDLPELVAPGALLVINDTRVRRARLLGHRRGTLGRCELLLLRKLDALRDGRERWQALGRASKPLTGAELDFGPLSARVLERTDDGTLHVELMAAEGSVERALERVGHVPLPPYVTRPDDALDAERYQTIFAKDIGSVAAPTAGLHLSRELLGRLDARGVTVARLTLHVGLGTFRPVQAEDLEAHVLHAEPFAVDEVLAAAVAQARRRAAPVVAVGTTVVRALESAQHPSQRGHVIPTSGETRLFIRPGYAFSVVDALLTNFHMPRSTLLALVAAFTGRERVLAAYADALARGYRFLSYGDAMYAPARMGG
jgi:S-adenosylmethionine:tRNA ribosyltransferase-isomerase